MASLGKGSPISNLIDAFVGKGAHVRQGSPAQNAARIKAPVLLFYGDKDINVSIGESRLMATRLRSAGKQVDYVKFKGLDTCSTMTTRARNCSAAAMRSCAR